MADTTNMVFSESTNKTGMYELFQDLTQTNSTSYSAYKFARDANNALLDYWMIALRSQGLWQVDDKNQTGENLISRNLVSGTGAYAITVDDESSANQVIEIERIECATNSSASNYQVLKPYDEMDDPDSIIYKRNNITGVPYQYFKKGNKIYLDPYPNYSATGGLQIFISRTPTYFAGTDTSKVAGIPHAHQQYLVYRPAYLYNAVNLPRRAPGVLTVLTKLEEEIKQYYSSRNKDQVRRIYTEDINFM